MATFYVRHLPHLHAIDTPIFLTWRLHGSLPTNRHFPAATTSGEAFVVMDQLLDAGCSGPLYLRMPDVAQVVVDALQYRVRMGECELHSYVVMPNHVHLLITACREVSKFMQSLKRHTAREANRILGLTGQAFWQEESYDRLVRDEEEFRRIVRYIEWNPVRARLVSTPEEFPWSSAKPIDNRLQVDNLPH